MHRRSYLIMQELPIRDIRDFSIAFALAVTLQSSQENDFVAKKGEEGLYAVLEQIFPQVRNCGRFRFLAAGMQKYTYILGTVLMMTTGMLFTTSWSRLKQKGRKVDGNRLQ